MKTAQKIFIGIGAVVLVIVAAGIYLWSSLDSLVEGAIEKYGSQVTQTRVEVGGVKLALTSGAGTISDVRVGNPAGFTRDYIFTLGNIAVAVDPKTVTEDVVVIDKVVIQSPQVFYEINDQGQSNVDALKKNVQQASSGAKAEGGESGKETRVIIRKLIIEKGEIDARIAALGDKDLSTNLPRIELTDIGKKSGGATPAEVGEKLANTLIARIGPAVANLGVDKYLGKTAEQARALLEGGATDAVKDKVEGLKGLFGN